MPRTEEETRNVRLHSYDYQCSAVRIDMFDQRLICSPHTRRSPVEKVFKAREETSAGMKSVIFFLLLANTLERVN